ncbi:MAG: YceI family protein [Hyphomonadaceae bacterium]
MKSLQTTVCRDPAAGASTPARRASKRRTCSLMSPPVAAPAPVAPDVSKLPAGAYKLDPSHASVTFRVNHLGFSFYTGSFRKFDAELQLDPANPETATVSATINLSSLSVPTPPDGFVADLLGENWLGANITPQATFQSTSVEQTGPATADIHGDFTLKGVTKPVTFKATFNGGYEGHPQDPNARIGFSANGVIKRSDFGITLGIPGPGSTMGVFDEVAFDIEVEFTGPPRAPD